MQEITKIKKGFWLIKYKRDVWEKIDSQYGNGEFRKRLEEKINRDFDLEKSRKIKEEIVRRMEKRILKSMKGKNINLNIDNSEY